MTAVDAIAGVDLRNRNVVVTGGSSGIGAETVYALARAGAAVTLTGKDRAAARLVADRVIVATGNRTVRVAWLDLANPASIETFAASWEGPLHILVANAGLSLPDLQHTAAGRETTFAVCHLGHFALTRALRLALQRAEGSRVVSVSSAMHLGSPVVFDDIDFRFRAYSMPLAYGQAKTANVLFAVGLTERWSGDGVFANAATPGIVPSTKLSRYRSERENRAIKATYEIPPGLLKTAAEGAATPVFAAASDVLVGVGGRYFEDCHEAAVLQQDRGSGLFGVAAYALDASNADRLWTVSEQLTG